MLNSRRRKENFSVVTESAMNERNGKPYAR